MSVIGSNILAGASGQGGYFIDRSLRFRSSASAYLNRTPASAGNQKTWTWSCWVKRSELGGAVVRLFNANDSGSPFLQTSLRFDADQLRFYNDANSTADVKSSAVYRDVSAWYHIVCAIDTTQATAANRVKLYVNGSQVTALATATYPNQNTDMYVNAARAHQIGSSITPSQYFDGYLTEANFIDGQALDPTYFGEYNADTGVWQPIKYTGTYGTNGFYLNFSDNSTTTTLGYDTSGNGNNWTANNISLTSGSTYDSMTDVPTLTSETSANYAVLNPLAKRRDVSTAVTFSEANLKATFPNAGGNVTFAFGTVAPTSGKFYWEITASAVVSNMAIGIGDQADQDAIANHSVIYVPAGGIYKYGTLQTTAASYTTNDIIGIAYDVDSGTLAYYKNNSLQYTVTGLTYVPSLPFNRGSTSDAITANFGQRPFAYTPPTGFKALNTYNLPDSTVKDGSDYFNTVLYTGNTSGDSVTGVGFQPDFVWSKNRSVVNNHELIDAVRGGSSALFSNLTNAEATQQRISSFDSDGWTYTTNSNSALANPYVGWTWKANGSGSSNNQGSITSTVSANQTAGFSIVTYTGTGANATVGHGLGSAPSMIIVKSRSAGGTGWPVYHTATGAGGSLYLHVTSAYGADSSAWNNTSPTSSVFSIGTNTNINVSSQTQVAYCFAEVEGFSKMGSYTGNGSTDGAFVYTGFRPAWVMIKRTDTTASWNISDTTRDPDNPRELVLYADDSLSERDWSLYPADILSNGFKLRTSAGGTNASGGTYIYLAFAENPAKYALAR